MKYILVDCLYLCHRAWHALGMLRFNSEPTSVIFGVMRDLDIFRTNHRPDFFVLAFDYGLNKRKLMLPGYKGNRVKPDATEEEIISFNEFQKQVNRLRSEILPDLGYRNVWYADGYEADDVIAYAVDDLLDEDDEGIIISGDADLYQCIRPNVRWYSPGKKEEVTLSIFVDRYGIQPNQWPIVKAIAGCSSDNVEGIPRVGEKTAANWLRDPHKLLKSGKKSNRYVAIEEGFTEYTERNLPIVQLPLAGLPQFHLKRDSVTDDKKADVCRRLGIRGRRPITADGVSSFGL
jgi:DNA polymerase-1